jgi:hypothetical protein
VGLNDLVDKVKDWAGKNPDKADQGVDKGSAMLKGKFAGHDEQFDSATEKAKSYLHGPGTGAPGAPAPDEAAPPPPPQ